MKEIKPESVRHAYIRLLTKGVAATTEEDIRLVDSLVKGGMLNGDILGFLTTDTDIRTYLVKGLTVEGYVFLQKLREEEWQESLWYKILKWTPAVIGFFIGLVAPAIQEWVKVLLGLTP